MRPKSSKNSNIAVWGLGKHALNNILPSISLCKSINLYGVFSRNISTVNSTCKKLKCRTWENEEEMLSDRNLDIVFLSTPIGMHYSQGIKILMAKKHFWCEKPLTTSLHKTKRLVQESNNNKVTICESFMYLYHPHFKAVKEFISNQELGEIRSINIKFGLPRLENPGFRFNQKLGGSCLLDVGSYPISAISSLFPDKKITLLSKHLRKSKKHAVDLGGKVFLKVNSKINCLLEWEYNSSYRNEIDIWGEKGSLFTEKFFSKGSDYIPKLNLTNKNGKEKNIFIPKANHFQIMLESFEDFRRNQKKSNLHKEEIISRAKLINRITNHY